MKNLSLFLVLSLSLTFFQSCVKEDINPPSEEAVPTIPPLETFVMSFDGYSESDVDTSEVINDGGADSRSATFHNWAYAGGNILVWNLALSLNMAVPIASFAESFNHQPVHVGNGKYAWTYNYNAASGIYFATLTGAFINNGADVEWIMTISKAGGFSDFEYYSGIVATDQSQANWTLNHRPNNPQTYLSIEYNKDIGSGDASIRYTNIIPGSNDHGDYIEYRIQADNDFNRAYDIFKINEGNTINIEWDEPTREGRVKSPVRFGDSDFHCWDENKKDTDC